MIYKDCKKNVSQLFYKDSTIISTATVLQRQYNK